MHFRHFHCLIILALCLNLASCHIFHTHGPTHSEYGDRPGPKNFTTVILDAGHGGKDSGARGNGLQEKDLALDLVKKLQKELTPHFKVVLIRDNDVFVNLNDRVRKANRYPNSVLISVHFNHGNRRLRGPETYYWRTDSYSLAKRIQRQMSSVIPSERGNRDLVRRRLRLTRNPEIPSVLLEGGYLSNRQEADLLRSETYRSRLAKAIANAVREQARLGDAGMGAIPKPIYMPPSKASDPRGSL